MFLIWHCYTVNSQTTLSSSMQAFLISPKHRHGNCNSFDKTISSGLLMTWLLMASIPCSGLSSRPIIQHSWKVKHEDIAHQRDKVLLSERGKLFTSSFCVPSPKGLWTISRGEILQLWVTELHIMGTVILHPHLSWQKKPSTTRLAVSCSYKKQAFSCNLLPFGTHLRAMYSVEFPQAFVTWVLT